MSTEYIGHIYAIAGLIPSECISSMSRKEKGFILLTEVLEKDWSGLLFRKVLIPFHQKKTSYLPSRNVSQALSRTLRREEIVENKYKKKSVYKKDREVKRGKKAGRKGGDREQIGPRRH